MTSHVRWLNERYLAYYDVYFFLGLAFQFRKGDQENGASIRDVVFAGNWIPSNSVKVAVKIRADLLVSSTKVLPFIYIER